MKQARRTDTNIIMNTKNGHNLTVCFPYVLHKTCRPTFQTKQSTGLIQCCNNVFCDSYLLEKTYFVDNVKHKHVHYKTKNKLVRLTQHCSTVYNYTGPCKVFNTFF